MGQGVFKSSKVPGPAADHEPSRSNVRLQEEKPGPSPPKGVLLPSFGSESRIKEIGSSRICVYSTTAPQERKERVSAGRLPESRFPATSAEQVAVGATRAGVDTRRPMPY